MVLTKLFDYLPSIIYSTQAERLSIIYCFVTFLMPISESVRCNGNFWPRDEDTGCEPR